MEKLGRMHLNTLQASKLLGISPRTLEGWRIEGRGPIYIKLGSRVVYSIEDLNGWVIEQRRSHT